MLPKQTHPCPHCPSEDTVKNGKIYYGKQNHKCKDGKRQFVERAPDPLEDYKEEQIPLLLMEQLSLRGISRVLQRGVSRLYKRMKGLWKRLAAHR